MKALPQLEPDNRYLCKVITKLSESHTTVSLLGHTKLISCFWSYKSKNDQATRLFFPFFFAEIEVERKWCTNSKNALWRVRSWDKMNADNCVSKEPKYRSLDDETTECVNSVVAC